MRIVCLSDTHGRHAEIPSIPEGDVLVHAGDFTRFDTFADYANFNQWLGTLPHPHKIVISGNHERTLESNISMGSLLLSNAIYLLDQEVVIDGVKFYGSPWQPEFYNWAFNLPRGEPLRRIWAKIPDDVQVLITHGPPFGILDKTRGFEGDEGEHVGCRELTARLKSLKELRLSVFGHIHESAGVLQDRDVTFVNASICNHKYRVANSVKVINI